MTGQNTTMVPLVYNGEIIHRRDEMLSLTDMWKASGSDPSRRPVGWLASESAMRFMDFLAESMGLLEVGNTHLDEPGKNRFGLVKVVRGGSGDAGRGSTMAHWQIGLAYAKYLSPEFHMWCNTVVRDQMMGKGVSTLGLPPDILEQIRRTDGISRMLSHKVTEMEKVTATMVATLAAIAAVVQPPQPVLIRHGKTAGQILRTAGVKGLKGLSVWFGNRLAMFGCRVEHNGCAEMGLTKARLFDPDKAEFFLSNGGRIALEQKVAERRGQGKLRLAVIKGDLPDV